MTTRFPEHDDEERISKFELSSREGRTQRQPKFIPKKLLKAEERSKAQIANNNERLKGGKKHQ